MEIGLDYMQMRSRAQYFGLKWAGIALLLGGIILVVAGVAYYGHLFWLRAGLDDYAAQHPEATLLEGAATAADAAGGVTVAALALPAGAHAKQLEELGFTAMPANAAWPVGIQPAATRLIVPALGIDVKLKDTSVTGGAIAKYASGNNPVGYLAVSANPGERGAMWFFGPATKGAAGFSSLTGAAERLAKGEDVLILVNNSSRSYLYAATHTEVIKSEELRLNSTGRATVHLVVRVPTGLYDHFLALNGQLVGVK